MEPDHTNDTFGGFHDAARDPAAAEAQDQSVVIEGSSEELRQAVDDVVSSAEELYRVADVFVGKHAQQRPYVVLGAALGVGFVLGGGLASRMGGRLLTFGGKMLVSRALEGFFEEGLEQANGFTDDD